ncbi:MAG: hypothetical protein WD805_04165 [Gaiellaceae bacterium]
MVIVLGILLVAAGAVLFWGVDRTVSGVEVSTIGVIVMAVGGIGVLASLLLSARATSGEDSLTPLGVEADQEEAWRPFRRQPPQ